MATSFRARLLQYRTRFGAGVPGAVVVLGFASLFTDLASEMIYPLLPVFLSKELGAGAVVLGVVEGVAEAVASMLKIVSGVWTDRWGRRKPLVVAGYGLSGLMRPLMGLAANWPLVVVIRAADRIGKGLRATPRDALIADLVPEDRRGRAYGLHRAMDHVGAIFGPLVALGLLASGYAMRDVFLLSILPGALVVGLLAWGIRDVPMAPRPEASWTAWADLQALGPSYHGLLRAVFVFSLGNASDTFLLLRLSDVGVPAAWVAGLWSLHHVVKSACTYAGGRLVDRLGARAALLSGWGVYIACDVVSGFSNQREVVIAAFMVYGLFFGLTEPAERAWVANLVAPTRRGAAFGALHGVMGLAALPASIVFGLLWTYGGPRLAFSVSAGLAAIAMAILGNVQKNPVPDS